MLAVTNFKALFSFFGFSSPVPAPSFLLGLVVRSEVSSALLPLAVSFPDDPTAHSLSGAELGE